VPATTKFLTHYSARLEHTDGTITIKSKKFEKEDLNPRKAVNAGVALLPGDRTGASGVLLATLTDNVGMPVLSKYFRAGRLRKNKLKKDVGELLRRFDVKPPVPGIELRNFLVEISKKPCLLSGFK
jgi:ribose transport system ATP-binding protein